MCHLIHPSSLWRLCNGAINISTLVVKVVNWQYLVIYLQKISKNKGHFKTLNKCGCNYIFKISNNQIVQYTIWHQTLGFVHVHQWYTVLLVQWKCMFFTTNNYWYFYLLKNIDQILIFTKALQNMLVIQYLYMYQHHIKSFNFFNIISI